MSGHIDALHYLRGLAALLVATGHAFWFPFDGTSQMSQLGLRLADKAPFWGEPFRAYRILGGGNFPVGVFFLLSGFVLQLSLAKTPPGAFLIGRFFRIFPVFWVAFAIHYLVLTGAGTAPTDLGEIARNIFLLDRRNILPVSWTLIFEARFYLAMAVLYYVGKAWRPWILVGAYVVMPTDTTFWLSFMAIGSLFCNAFVSDDKKALHFYSALAGTVVWWGLALGISPILDLTEMSRLGCAFVVFCGCLAISKFVPENRSLRFLGDVSYPLYCSHFTVVIVGHFLLIGVVPARVAPFLLIGIALPLAFLLHIAVEKPSMTLGKRMASLACFSTPAGENTRT